MKSPFTLNNPRLSPAQRSRFQSLAAIISGSLSADAAKSAAIGKLQRDIGKLDGRITGLETSGETAAAAKQLSTLRTQRELLNNRLAEAQRAAAAPRADKLTQERLEAFNALAAELGEFFKDYTDKKIQEFAAILAPLFTEGYSPSPLGYAEEWVKNSRLLATLSTRFVVYLREGRGEFAGRSAADRLVAIVDLLLSGKEFFAGDNLRTL